MAQMQGPFSFTGTLGNLSAYKMKGSDKIIVRRKGGPSKEQIEESVRFKNTRRNIAEFGGRAAVTKWIRKMLAPQLPLADYSLTGELNKLLKPVQAMDVVNDWGQRNIYLSKNPGLLEGFNLNKEDTFDSVIRNPVSGTILRDSLTARVMIPELLPGINFFVPEKHPFYSFTVALGIIPDLYYTEHGYKPAGNYDNASFSMESTQWYPVLKGSPAIELAINNPAQLPDESFSIMLSVGISFGTMRDIDKVQQVKHAGSAKVLRMG